MVKTSRHFTHYARIAASGLAGVLALSLLVPPAAGAAEDQPNSIVETYGDWTVSCRQSKPENGDTQTICQTSQELRDQKTGKLVFALALPAKKNPSGANAVVVAPFGLRLSSGVACLMIFPVHLRRLSHRQLPTVRRWRWLDR